MKKYHVAAGDGKGYYGIGYESYREATELLKISQSHDPQAHIVEEEYHFTNADHIRAMSDKELTGAIFCNVECSCCPVAEDCKSKDGACTDKILKWLRSPAKEDQQ